MSARVSFVGGGILLCVLATPALADQPVLQDLTQRDVSLEVWAAVTRSPHLTIFDDVRATVREGQVTLAGKVTSDVKRRQIATHVASVKGVRDVQDNIEVFPASRLDDVLRDRIGRAIYGNAGFWHYAMLPSPPIHILVEGSHVTLRGVVRTDLDRTMAQALAMQCEPLSVTNELTIGDAHDGRE